MAVELDLLSQWPPETPARLKDRLEHLSARTNSLLEDVHRLSHGLHPAKLEQLGLAPALRGLCRELESGGVITVRFSEHEVPRHLEADVALCLYRVAQEALWNVVKHSGTKTASVELSASESAVLLKIADQGKGFNPKVAPPSASLGLVSMRERIRSVRAEFQWISEPGRGTLVTVRVPLLKEPTAV